MGNFSAPIFLLSVCLLGSCGADNVAPGMELGGKGQDS